MRHSNLCSLLEGGNCALQPFLLASEYDRNNSDNFNTVMFFLRRRGYRPGPFTSRAL